MTKLSPEQKLAEKNDFNKNIREKAINILAQQPVITMVDLAKKLGIGYHRMKAILGDLFKARVTSPLKKRTYYSTKSQDKRLESIKKANAHWNTTSYSCVCCGNTKWLGHPIIHALDLDHINGDHNNNDPNNVAPKCKNCHNLTKTRFPSLRAQCLQIQLSPDLVVKDANMLMNETDYLKLPKANERQLLQGLLENKRKAPNKESLDDILDGKVPGYSPQRIGDRLIGAGLKKPVCEGCGLTHWRGITIRWFLNVHHKDGVPANNNFVNLGLYCGNCHNFLHDEEIKQSLISPTSSTVLEDGGSTSPILQGDTVKKIALVAENPLFPLKETSISPEIEVFVYNSTDFEKNSNTRQLKNPFKTSDIPIKIEHDKTKKTIKVLSHTKAELIGLEYDLENPVVKKVKDLLTNRKPHENMKMLAEKSGISYTTFGRVGQSCFPTLWISNPNQIKHDTNIGIVKKYLENRGTFETMTAVIQRSGLNSRTFTNIAKEYFPNLWRPTATNSSHYM